MAIIKTIKVIGKTKRITLLENLVRKQKKAKEIITIPEMRKKINTQYRNYRVVSKIIIEQTENMLSVFLKDPKLKNAEFVFIDRDALPYMFVAKEICSKYNLKPEQFKPILLTKEVEQHIDTKLQPIINPKEYITLKSNSSKLVYASKRIPLTPAVENLKKWMRNNINLNKPIVVIDSGYNGTSVKRIQFLLTDINPKISSYSAMFYATDFAKENIDYFLGNTNVHEINTVENIPKFGGKLLEITDQGKIIREKANLTTIHSASNPAETEIFMVALRSALAKYKQKK